MADVIRASITGTLPGGEVWSVNPVYKITTGSEILAAELTAACAAINALTMPTGLRGAMTAACKITGVVLEARTHAGVLEARAEGLKGTPEAGNGVGNLPFQSAVCFSMRTTAGGTHGRGRIYWPATGVALDSATARIPLGTVTSMLTGAKTWLKQIETAIDSSVDETVALAVWSRTQQSSAIVTRMLVGDVLDVQRRRRDAVHETYSDAVYP